MEISTLKKKSVFILDLDGTIYIDDSPIESAISFINNSKKEFYFVTNNTSKSIKNYVKKLSNMGIKSICKEQIITPICPLVDYLTENDINTVYTIATDSFKADLASFGITILEEPTEACEALILAYDTTLDYKKICDASRLLNLGKKYLATHIDINCPSKEFGLPDVGSFVSMFKTSTLREPQNYFGKPSPKMIESILNKHKKEDIVFVGDRIYTDKKLAENCGIDFCLVLSGETSLNDVKNFDKDFYIIEKLSEDLC